MASISKFSTAMLSVPNEITLAAANLNFNFSLMKVEAPKEFNDLRDALSRTRRYEAEEGLPHITARTLGALFQSLIPPIPNLTAAYGKRVSDISRELTSEPASQSHGGLFSDQVGPDGTSIWAAATSGEAAIAIHLLSCMLARIWKNAEATSLWVELVERRKEEIQQTSPVTSASGLAAIMAAQQIFSREQLAKWDASARSWLQTADTAKRLQQTQLMLIINNIQVPVNASKDPYESVIQAWVSAMNAMEKLLANVPQRVQDGAILLAISAWHLYPNMQVLSEDTKDIDQEDDLMSGSILTISSYGKYTDKEGVFWSLPLSRMRYYSPPVLAERHLASDTSRISMHEFQVVVLGAILGQWKTLCRDQDRCCRLIVNLYHRLMQASVDIPPWFGIIANSAQRVLGSKGSLHAQHLKLLKLGSRRALINEPEIQPPQFFSLAYFHVLLRTLGTTLDKIRFVQRAIESRSSIRERLVIRYRRPSLVDGGETDIYVFIPVGPAMKSAVKISSVSQTRFPSQSCSWVVGRCSKTCKCGERFHPNFRHSVDSPLPMECESGCSGNGKCAGCYNRITKMGLESENEKTTVSLIHFGLYKAVRLGEITLQQPNESQIRTYCVILGDESTVAVFAEKAPTTLTKVSLSERRHPRNLEEERKYEPRREWTATIDEIESVISSTAFDSNNVKLQSWWHEWSDSGREQQARSFRALVYATSVYESMPTASVSIEVIKKPLYHVSWARPIGSNDAKPSKGNRTVVIQQENSRRRQPIPIRPGTQMPELSEEWNKRTSKSSSFLLSVPRNVDQSQNNMNKGAYVVINNDKFTFESELAIRFSCIAWFESGEFDIDPMNLHGVMALANGDSIYVASAMLVDPCIDSNHSPIRRVFGSLGRSEMSLLVPPSKLRLTEPDPAAWNLINHSPFDGTFQNCFASTSLHLTFTDFEMPLDVGTRGLRDRQVVLVEAVISIEDREKHVGDLDILSMFRGHLSLLRTCPHGKNQQHDNRAGSKLPGEDDLISLDCWDEFLDPPSGRGIFRAHGNWQARLAATAASIQAGNRVLVLPPEPCLRCLENGDGFDLIIA